MVEIFLLLDMSGYCLDDQVLLFHSCHKMAGNVLLYSTMKQNCSRVRFSIFFQDF